MERFVRLRQKLALSILAGSVAIMTVSMNGCDSVYWNEQQSLSKVRAHSGGQITVLTTEDPLIYSKSKHGGEASGIDHDLLSSFAGHYNLNLKFVVLPDQAAVMQALQNGQGDIGAARLSTPDQNSGLLSSPAYDESSLSLFCHVKAQVENIEDLAGMKVLIQNKDLEVGLFERLRTLAPKTKFEVIETRKVSDIMADVAVRNFDCAIVDDLSGEFYNRYHTSIEKVSVLTKPQAVNWVMAGGREDLQALLQAWFQRASREDEIMRVNDRYKSFLSELGKNELRIFFRDQEEVLPEYRQTFKQAADKHRLPWQLIAAVAYQESHWNPEARSYTGVRGLMQLTTETADHVGIEDRTDPVQSIWGGTKYLRYLLNKIPSYLNSRDRISLALAAYNVGFAHLRDAQKLAERMGRNPNSWHQMREILPLLEDDSYASELEFGPARGKETVDFVERVRSFYSLMTVSG
jgi:membrane-bound lytic murein transglycosylase F